jgi:hypothetical protein
MYVVFNNSTFRRHRRRRREGSGWGFLYIIDTVFDAGPAWLVNLVVGATPEEIPTSKWPRRG